MKVSAAPSALEPENANMCSFVRDISERERSRLVLSVGRKIKL